MEASEGTAKIKTPKGILISLVAGAVVLLTSVIANGTDSGERVILKGNEFVVPHEYRADVSEDGIYINMARPGYGPLIDDKPGWQDNVIVLLDHDSGPMKDVYNNSFFKKATRLQVIDSFKPYFVEILDMGKAKIYIPNQDITIVDEGIITCFDKIEAFKYNSCYLLTDYNGLKLQIDFGYEDLKNWKSIKSGVIERLNEFANKGRM